MWSRRRWLGLVALAACRPDPRDPNCRRATDYVGAPRLDGAADVLDGRQTGAIDGALAPTLTERLEAALDEVLVNSRAPAISAAYAVPGAGLWTATRGLACAVPPTPVTTDAKFQACSIGKLVTAVLVLRLVERGRLRLEEPIARWFPRYPGSSRITVDHLLTHTGGVYSFNSGSTFDQELTEPHSPESLVAGAAGHANLFCPGATWAYSNTGYVMLGLIVERSHGASLAEVIAAEIAGPLGLRGLVGQQARSGGRGAGARAPGAGAAAGRHALRGAARGRVDRGGGRRPGASAARGAVGPTGDGADSGADARRHGADVRRSVAALRARDDAL